MTKILPAGAELLFADTQADRRKEGRDEANIALSNFANAPIKVKGLRPFYPCHECS